MVFITGRKDSLRVVKPAFKEQIWFLRLENAQITNPTFPQVFPNYLKYFVHKISVGTNQPRGVLIEKDDSCGSPLRIGASHDDRVNDQMNPINNNLPAIHFSTQRRTCQTFIVAVPAIPALVTELLVECIDP